MKPYEVVCTDSDPRWPQFRHELITASSVATLLGVSPWSTREQLLEEKMQEEPRDWKDSRNMWHGRYDEHHNMRKFGDITGIRCRATHLFLRSTKLTKIGCTLDGLCIAPRTERELVSVATKKNLTTLVNYVSGLGGTGLIEMKQTETWNGKNWKTAVPPYYRVQVQTQLFVTGYDWAIIACAIGAADMTAYVIEKDDFFEDELTAAVADFVKELEDGR